MIGMVHWAAFVPAAVLVAAAPGANQLLALRNGFRYGPGAAIGASAGRFAAFALMVVAVAAGLGALLAASAVVFAVLKWCGVAYLGWLGLRTIRTAGRGPEDGGAAADGASAWRLARQEFVVAAANPKALILFTVFLPQFVAAPGTARRAAPRQAAVSRARCWRWARRTSRWSSGARAATRRRADGWARWPWDGAYGGGWTWRRVR
ncbi:LysE family translocator [Actinomadura sp. J1-007]|uniref:LysE family translocator n=1 Tax=Actinomadura sp. J1-007 TaxID=2661913 RepID=UPI001F4FC35A|nr:LysE family transporter [Actinomadura sp. J1-007]